MDKETKQILNEIIKIFKATSKPVKISKLKKIFKKNREQIIIACDYLVKEHKIKYVYYPDYKEKEFIVPVVEELHPATYKFEGFLKFIKIKVLDIIELSIAFAALIISIIALFK